MADKDHEAALAELLGEVGPLDDKKAGGDAGNRSSNGVHTAEDDVSVERELNLGPLDITSERDNDVFAALEEGGLDLDLVKYADHDVVRSVMENSDATDLKQGRRLSRTSCSRLRWSPSRTTWRSQTTC